MSLNKESHALISNLKGRIAKALNTPSKFGSSEIQDLLSVYNSIDGIILNKSMDNSVYLHELIRSSESLKGSQKEYIRDHILPLVKKISTRRWR